MRSFYEALMPAAVVLAAFAACAIPSASAQPNTDAVVVVEGAHPTADADTMAAKVAGLLERRLSFVSGIASMSSASASGRTRVTVTFDSGYDAERARHEVLSAFDGVRSQLPVDTVLELARAPGSSQ